MRGTTVQGKAGTLALFIFWIFDIVIVGRSMPDWWAAACPLDGPQQARLVGYRMPDRRTRLFILGLAPPSGWAGKPGCSTFFGKDF